MEKQAADYINNTFGEATPFIGVHLRMGSDWVGVGAGVVMGVGVVTCHWVWVSLGVVTCEIGWVWLHVIGCGCSYMLLGVVTCEIGCVWLHVRLSGRAG